MYINLIQNSTAEQMTILEFFTVTLMFFSRSMNEETMSTPF